MRSKKTYTVGVFHTGKLTPELLQRIGGKLGNPLVRELLARVKRGTTEQFSIGLGGGVTIEYPAGEKCLLKVEVA